MAGPLELVALDLIAELSAKQAAELRKVVRSISSLKEIMMAKFDGLNQALDNQTTEFTAATQRVADDVQNLQDTVAALTEKIEVDAEDQAAVDAATARVNESITALRGLDPVPAPAEPEPQPEEPTA